MSFAEWYEATLLIAAALILIGVTLIFTGWYLYNLVRLWQLGLKDYFSDDDGPRGLFGLVTVFLLVVVLAKVLQVVTS